MVWCVIVMWVSVWLQVAGVLLEPQPATASMADTGKAVESSFTRPRAALGRALGKDMPHVYDGVP